MGTIPVDKIVSVDELKQSIPQEKIEQQIVRNAAQQRVANDPLPGPMANAVGDGNVMVSTSKGNVSIRPFVAYDFVILKKLNSPLYNMMLDASSNEKTNFEEDDAFIMIYQFTRTCKEIRKVLTKGVEFFKEEALTTIADEYSIQDIASMVQVITGQMTGSFSTMVTHEVVTEGEDKKKQLTEV